jgi:hypothetical protein
MSFGDKITRDFYNTDYSSDSEAPKAGLSSSDLANLVPNAKASNKLKLAKNPPAKFDPNSGFLASQSKGLKSV